MIPMKINSEIINELRIVLASAKKIAIVSHISPDGDNVGSVLAMSRALMANCVAEIDIIKTDLIPENLMFLPGINLYKETISKEIYDIVIVLDCGDLDRLGDSKKIADQTKYLINIDHHKTNTLYGDLNILNPKASSTGEIVYTLLKELDYNIDIDCATCIYTAMSTDTGSFKYSNTSSYTHFIVSELMDIGIDISNINVELYQNRELSKTQLFIKSVSALEFFRNNKIAVAHVNSEMLNETKSLMGDSDGIVEFIRDIKNVEVACLIKIYENDNLIKCSFRSKNDVDVSEFCENHNGGGHQRAAGCTFNTLEKSEVIKCILNEIDI